MSSLELDFYDRKGGPVIPLQFMAVITDGGQDNSAYINIANCYG